MKIKTSARARRRAVSQYLTPPARVPPARVQTSTPRRRPMSFYHTISASSNPHYMSPTKSFTLKMRRPRSASVEGRRTSTELLDQ